MLLACRNQKPAAGFNWSVQKAAHAPASAPAASAAIAAPAMTPAAAVSGASAPDGAPSGATQLIGAVTSVSGGQPTVLPSEQADAAPDGQTSTAGSPLVSAPAPAPAQAEQTKQPGQHNSASSAALSKDPSNSPSTPDRFYSAAMAAAAYVSDSGPSPMSVPAPAPRQQLSISGVTTFGQMLGGRRRLRA